MIKQLSILIATAIIFSGVSISNLHAAPKAKLCLNEDTGRMFSKRRCGKKAVVLDLAKLAGQIGNTCSACGTDMSGDWTYTQINTSNIPVSTRSVTLSQSGKNFSGSNTTHTTVGIVEGNWVRLTQTVSGEEGEGFVRLAEGSLYQVGNILLGTLVIINDTFNDQGGALIFRKNLAP